MFFVVSDENKVQQRILIAIHEEYDQTWDPDKSHQEDDVYFSINPIPVDDESRIDRQQL